MRSAPTVTSRPRARGRLTRTLTAAVAIVGGAGALAGCGSSHKIATSADPASVIPASAALYAGATVRPDTPESTEALAAAHALSHQADPYLRLLAALQTPGSATLNYKRDVAPWLGPHAGVYLSSLSAAGPLSAALEQGLLGSSSTATAFPLGTNAAQGAIVLDTSDVTKARAFLDAQAGHAGASATSYRGVHYEQTTSGLAFGIVARFAVIGSESGMHGVIDTTLGGPALKRSDGYSRLLTAAPAGALAHIYSNPAASSTGAGADASTGASQQGLSGVLALLSSGEQANVSLLAAAGSLTLDADTLAATSKTSGILSSDPRGAQALGELPGESWLAIGLGDVGGSLSQDVQSLRGLASLLGGAGATGVEAPASSTLNLKSLIEGMLAPLNVLGAPSPQARHAFTSWMGSAGIFAGGASLLELKAAVVIESKDPALSRAAVNELGAQLRKGGATLQPTSIAGTEAAIGARIAGLPVVLDIADGRDSSGHTKFVLGFGEASVTAALDPPSTLSSSTSRTRAAASLGAGIQPSIILEVPTLLSLLEGVGLTEDPSISKFVPYLRGLTTIAGGGHEPGAGVQRFRLSLGLQRPSGG